MQRDHKCLDKVIRRQTANHSLMANSVMNSFKLVYLSQFENKTSIKPIPDQMKRYIDINFKRFKSKDKDMMNKEQDIEGQYDEILLNDSSINVESELKSFLRSCGNNLNDEDLRLFMNFLPEVRNSKCITPEQFHQIWAIVVHFQKMNSKEIILSSFHSYLGQYYSFPKDEINDIELNEEKLKDFLSFHSKLFTKTQQDFILSESKLIGNSYTVRELVLVLSSSRRFYPN